MHEHPNLDPRLVKRIAHTIAESNRALKGMQAARWKRPNGALVIAPTCAYCASEVNARASRGIAVDLLVPVAHGGNQRTENTVLSCPACSASRGGADLLSWSRLAGLENRDALLQKRLQALESCTNHLTPHRAAVNQQTLRAHLQTRWSHPRVQVYAANLRDTSFIGWANSRGGVNDYAALRAMAGFSFGGWLAWDEAVVVYALPEARFLDLIWALIELNALVFPLKIAGLPAVPHDASDGRHYWGVHLKGFASLRRRREHAGPGARDAAPAFLTAPVRLPRRVYDTTRERRLTSATTRRWAVYLERRAQLDALREDERWGRCEPVSQAEWDLMEAEVDALCLAATGPAPRAARCR